MARAAASWRTAAPPNVRRDLAACSGRVDLRNECGSGVEFVGSDRITRSSTAPSARDLQRPTAVLLARELQGPQLTQMEPARSLAEKLKDTPIAYGAAAARRKVQCSASCRLGSPLHVRIDGSREERARAPEPPSPVSRYDISGPLGLVCTSRRVSRPARRDALSHKIEVFWSWHAPPKHSECSARHD